MSTVINACLGILFNSDTNQVLLASRPEGKVLAGYWEFPGGKIEPGESSEEALIREIKEELSIDIHVDQWMCTTNYDYKSFHLTMHCYLCSIIAGKLELREHKSAKWLDTNWLNKVEWLPADKEVIQILSARTK